MLATFVVEVGLAIYVLLRHKLNSIARIAVVTLLSLAVFQWAEYAICAGHGPTILWMRAGFVAITLLPALGVHLVGILRRNHRLTKFAYVSSAATILWLLLPGGTISAVCAGNYVIFDLHPILESVYVLYYFGFLLAALYGAVTLAPHSRAARWFTVGYLSFLLPMGIIYLIDRSAYQAVPSIMCGFAVLFAAILAFKVVPTTRMR